jgi:hypothetical protein
VLKSLCDGQDAERLAAFNGQIFGPMVTEMTRSLVYHHPATRPEHWLFVEDEASRQIVSSLCLIPWQWRYEDVTLRAGEVGIVSTLDSYRNRGLIRAQMARHKELLHEGHFDLSHIQGIPYFYRQFDYEYAMPLEPGWNIGLHAIPEVANESRSRYTFRPATVDDVPVLMRLYDAAATCLNVSNVRSAEVWRFLFEHSAGTDTEAETWLMFGTDGQPAGYWRIALHGFGQGLIVSETSRVNADAAQAVLAWQKATAIERNKPYIRFNLPVTNDLLRVARGWGAQDTNTYAWQIHLVDVARLLCKLGPVLERRIAASPFAGLSQVILINLYRETFELHFERGRLLGVNSIGFADKGEIRIPPLLFAPLVLGYRSREELRQNYPDINIWGQAQCLVDVMFPKLEPFILTNY